MDEEQEPIGITADKEAAMRYAKLADAASSGKMRRYWTKCAMECAIVVAVKTNQQESV